MLFLMKIHLVKLYSKDQPNNWLCFDFKEHRIIPTDYTIKSYHVEKNYRSPKSWAIEVSNDNSSCKLLMNKMTALI